jgi:putative hemolysin
MSNIIPSHITFDSLAKSNMPAAQKSAIRRWYENNIAADGAQGAIARAKMHASVAVENVRAGGEALIVGGGLGALAATHGLDYKAGTASVPIDASLGIAALATSAAMAHTPFAGDARNAGITALGVFAFRKTYGVIAELQKKNGKTPVAFAGEDVDADFGGEDPIISAARAL